MSYPIGRPAVNRVAMSGKRFGHLVVITEVQKPASGIRVFTCLCDCGRILPYRGGNLRSGNTTSCGCASKIVHGHTIGGDRSPEYMSWDHMIQRCTNPNNDGYGDYGGRGIRVCNQWLDFRNFLRDMGKRPLGKSLDRINNDGNYDPSNCRWATQSEQNYNRRRSKR